MNNQMQSFGEYIIRLVMLGYKIQFYQESMPECLCIHMKKGIYNVKRRIDYEPLSSCVDVGDYLASCLDSMRCEFEPDTPLVNFPD